MAKDDAYVKFHIKQSLALIVVGFLVMIVSRIYFFPFAVFGIFINMFLGILGILGILNALQGKEKELPLVGSLAESFNF